MELLLVVGSVVRAPEPAITGRGVHRPLGRRPQYTYVGRTTPGTFVVPPAKAEEICAGDVRRTGVDRMIVE